MDKLPRQLGIAKSVVGYLRGRRSAAIHTSRSLRKDDKDGDVSDSKGEIPQEQDSLKSIEHGVPFSRKDKRSKLSPAARLKEMLSEYKMPQEYVHVMDEIFSTPPGTQTSPSTETPHGSADKAMGTSQHFKDGQPASDSKAATEACEHDDDGWGLGLENVKFPEDKKLFISPFINVPDKNTDDKEGGGPGGKKKWQPQRKMSPLHRVHDLIPKEYWTKVENKNLETIVVGMKKADPKLPEGDK